MGAGRSGKVTTMSKNSTNLVDAMSKHGRANVRTAGTCPLCGADGLTRLGTHAAQKHADAWEAGKLVGSPDDNIWVYAASRGLFASMDAAREYANTRVAEAGDDESPAPWENLEGEERSQFDALVTHADMGEREAYERVTGESASEPASDDALTGEPETASPGETVELEGVYDVITTRDGLADAVSALASDAGVVALRDARDGDGGFVAVIDGEIRGKSGSRGLDAQAYASAPEDASAGATWAVENYA